MPYGLRISTRAFGLAVPVHFIWEMSQAYASGCCRCYRWCS